MCVPERVPCEKRLPFRDTRGLRNGCLDRLRSGLNVEFLVIVHQVNSCGFGEDSENDNGTHGNPPPLQEEEQRRARARRGSVKWRTG